MKLGEVGTDCYKLIRNINKIEKLSTYDENRCTWIPPVMIDGRVARLLHINTHYADYTNIPYFDACLCGIGKDNQWHNTNEFTVSGNVWGKGMPEMY